MRAASYIERAVSAHSVSDPQGRQGSRAASLKQLGICRRCLIGATTFRFKPERELPLRHARILLGLAQTGWIFRQASARHYLCWRNSRLLHETTIPIAIFPSGDCQLSPGERTMVILFELFRRIARVDLVANGLPPATIERPELVALLSRRVAQKVWDEDVGCERAPHLLQSAEFKIIEAASGCRVSDAEGRRAFLPPHLTRL